MLKRGKNQDSIPGASIRDPSLARILSLFENCCDINIFEIGCSFMSITAGCLNSPVDHLLESSFAPRGPPIENMLSSIIWLVSFRISFIVGSEHFVELLDLDKSRSLYLAPRERL